MKKINEAETSEVESTNKSAPTENEVDPLTGELRDFDTTDSIKGAKTLKDIINLPYSEFIQKLTGKNPPSEGKSVAEIDHKVTKVLSLGKEDMKIEDEVIPVNDADNLQVKNLFPTQAQIGLLDSIGFVAFVLPENAKNALLGKAYFKGERILTANNKYILDGHHRWSQTYLINPDATIPALNLTLNVKDENEMLKIVQLAIAATYGSIAMKAANAATDIYDDTIISKWNTEYKIEGNSTLGLVKAVLEGKCGIETVGEGADIKNVEKFIEIIKTEKGLENREAVEKYLAKNADLLKANNNKPEGAPPRSIMPQPGDTAKAVGKGKEKIAGIPADFVNKIKSGELNYKSDFIRFKKDGFKFTESKESKWIKTFEQFRNNK